MADKSQALVLLLAAALVGAVVWYLLQQDKKDEKDEDEKGENGEKDDTTQNGGKKNTHYASTFKPTGCSNYATLSGDECVRVHSTVGCGGAESYVVCPDHYKPYNVNDKTTTPAGTKCRYGCTLDPSADEKAVAAVEAEAKAAEVNKFKSNTQQDFASAVGYIQSVSSSGWKLL
jgi:hypothetical protein